MGTSIGLDNFARDMGKIADKVGSNAASGLRAAVFSGVNEAVLRTRYRTGRARSNWVLSVGGPVFENEDPPGSEGEATQKPLTRALIDLPGWDIDRDEIHLANGVPYIEHLDQGSPTTAPDNMTEAALMKIASVLRNLNLLRGV